MKHPTREDIRIGNRIRERRLSLEVSLHQLARDIGTTPSRLLEHEKAKTRVSAARLERIAAALRTPTGWFTAPSGGDRLATGP